MCFGLKWLSVAKYHFQPQPNEHPLSHEIKHNTCIINYATEVTNSDKRYQSLLKSRVFQIGNLSTGLLLYFLFLGELLNSNQAVDTYGLNTKHCELVKVRAF